MNKHKIGDSVILNHIRELNPYLSEPRKGFIIKLISGHDFLDNIIIQDINEVVINVFSTNYDDVIVTSLGFTKPARIILTEKWHKSFRYIKENE